MMGNSKITGSYPEMTQDEYRESLKEILDKITNTQALRYFYIFVSEKTKATPYIFERAEKHDSIFEH